MALILPEDINREATPICAHFNECGGCSLQDVDYNLQLKVKADVVSEMLGRPVEIVPSPNPYGYRHRMDYVVSLDKLGLRKRSDGKTAVDLTECHLVQSRVSDVLQLAREWIRELEVPGYDLVRNRGDLRYLTFRHAFSSDQLMITAVTSDVESVVEPLLEKLQTVAESVVWSIQPRIGDTSVGEIHKILGQESILQSIRGKEFEISPNAFFQNNLLLLDRMFDHIAQLVHGYTLDLFCGIGAIGISTIDNIDRLVGVEIFDENIRLAKLNAARNGVEAEFINDNANHFLAFYEGDTPDVVVIDPPRSGLAPKLVRKLLRLAPQRIVYVSCNPRSFMDDLIALEGYELTEAVAYDMFPQTPHVEMITCLEKC